jgi:hypothetical protein
VAAALAERKAAWVKPEGRYTRGVLKLFIENAASPMQGGGMG